MKVRRHRNPKRTHRDNHNGPFRRRSTELPQPRSLGIEQQGANTYGERGNGSGREEFVSLFRDEAEETSVTFFEPPPPLEPDERDERPPSPPWYGPPENVIGRAVPLDFVLARTEMVAVARTYTF